MSNESNPSSATLRLKPRLRPADGAGTVGTVVETGGETAVVAAAPAATGDRPMVPAEPAAPKVRLRPKLDTGAENVTTGVVPPSAGSPAAAPAAAAPVPGASLPPPVFIQDSPSVPSPTSAAPAVSPPAVPAPVPAAAVIGDPGKFKLKPKVPSAAPAKAAAGGPPVPPLFLPDEIPGPVAAPVPGKAAASLPPPPAPGDPAGRSGKSNPPQPVPYVKVEAADLVPEVDLVVPLRPRQRGSWKRVVVTLLVLGGAGYGVYAGWPHLPPEFSFAGYTVRTKPGLSITKSKTTTSGTAPTPSATLNQLAQLPGNAIEKAQGALAARRASGQDRVDAAAIGEDLPSKPFGVPPAAPIKPAAPAPKAAPSPTSVTTIAPGLSATMPVEAAAEASAEFRAFIVGARVSGVFQGNPARAVINGRLMRVGEVVDAGLGITFEGLDSQRRSLVFKDRTGATVSRRF